MDRQPKTIFQLDSPFTTVQWPQISPRNQDTILELLCNLLAPIGQYRHNHIIASKGKRSKRRKRQQDRLGEESTEGPSRPQPPDISPFIMVGLNSITRSLELSSQNAIPEQSLGGLTDDEVRPSCNAQRNEIVDAASIHISKDDGRQRVGCHFSAIFVLRSSQPSMLHAHLPHSIANASLAHPELPATRLVQLPKGCDARICSTLGLSRVSFVGLLEGAPHAKSLVDLARECVPEIDIPWLQETQSGKYLPVKINAIETFGPMRKKEPKNS